MKKFFLIFGFIFIASLSAIAETELTTNDDTIDDYIDMARIYTSSAQYAKALQYIETIEKISPNNPKILYEKAVILKNYNQPILARNLMREIAIMAPEYKESYLYKEFFKEDLPGFYTPKSYDASYYTKKGIEALNENKNDKAVEYFKKSLQLNRNVENLNNLAVAYIKSSTPKEALKLLNNAIYLDTQYAKTFLNLGIYYFEIEHNNKKAISNLKNSIRLDSRQAAPFYIMGNVYNQQNMPDTAIEYYRLALAKDDSDIDVYNALGATLYKLQLYDEAYSVFEKSLQIELDSHETYEYLAKIAIILNKQEEAESYIRKAIEIKPSPENYFILVKSLYNNAKYANCIDILKSKIADENNSEMYNYLGLCDFQLGNYKSAIINFQKAVSIEAKPSYYYNLAVCYNSLNDKVNMQKYIDAATHAEPKTPEDYLDIMKVYQDLGQAENILSTVNNAIIAYPDERQFYNLKLEILKQTGKEIEYKAFSLEMHEKFKKAPIYMGK